MAWQGRGMGSLLSVTLRRNDPMFLVVNAFKSISRAKGRNILVAIIVFAIAFASSISFAIRAAADKAKDAGLAQETITASISLNRERLIMGAPTEDGLPDMESMREVMRSHMGLSLNQLIEYALSSHVKDFYYTASTSLNAGQGIVAYSSESSSNSGPNNMWGGGGRLGMGAGGRPDGAFANISMGDFSLTGYSSEEAMSQFIAGETVLSQGSMFEPSQADKTCLISSELALFNGLAVGDNIELTNPNNTEETYGLKIVGIYENLASDRGLGQVRFGTANDPANLICVSYGTMEAIKEGSANQALTGTDAMGQEITTELVLQTAGTFAFSNQEDYKNFEAELQAKGLPEYYSLSSFDLSSYANRLVPLENLSSFAASLLTLILGIGAVVLIVVNIFNIRERKYEVGVLTAIGIRKSKVALQFVVELLTVTLIATLAGTGLGAVAAVPVSNNLLSSQVAAMASNHFNRQQSFGRPGTGGPGMPEDFQFPGFAEISNPVEYVSAINATVDLNILLKLIAVAISLTMVSSLAGVIFVMRYDPLRILASRD